jgi:hypothetical protein
MKKIFRLSMDPEMEAINILVYLIGEKIKSPVTEIDLQLMALALQECEKAAGNLSNDDEFEIKSGDVLL